MKKQAKKTAPKKAVKKAAPKKAAKKTAVKTATTKKSAKKTATKKVAAKKAAPKKVAPKKGKAAAKKAQIRAKKAVKAQKKTVTTTTTTTVVTTTTTKFNPRETHYLLILDESGSMGSVKKETLDGLNEQLQTIKNLDDKYKDQEYFVSIVKFDDEIVPLLTDVPSANVKQLGENDYRPDAMTALHDAVGVSVNKLKDRIKSKLENGEASVFVVILTDGAENASKEYNAEKIKNLITELEKTGLWTFTFIGANQDSVLTARNLGINSNNTVNYTASGVGTKLAFASMSSAMSKGAMYRSAGVFTNDSRLSEVTAVANSIGEDASLLDLSGNVSDEDIQKALAATTGSATGSATNSTDNSSK